MRWVCFGIFWGNFGTVDSIGASSVSKRLRIVWGLASIQPQQCGRLPMTGRTRCWMRWIWLGCNQAPYVKFSTIMNRTMRRAEILLVLERGLCCSMSITFFFSSTLRCTWGLFSTAFCARKGTLSSQGLVNTSEPMSIRNSTSKISLPIFFKRVGGVVVAKPVHKMHIGLLFVRKRHIRSLTAHLTTARPDCAVCYLTYCRRCYDYMITPTPGHISHASTAAHSANAAIRNHAYDISGLELPLELDPSVLALNPGQYTAIYRRVKVILLTIIQL